MGEWLSPDRISVAAVASVRPNNSLEPPPLRFGYIGPIPASRGLSPAQYRAWLAGRLP